MDVVGELPERHVEVRVGGTRLTLLWNTDERRWLVLRGVRAVGFLVPVGGTYAHPWVSYRSELTDGGGVSPARGAWLRALERMGRPVAVTPASAPEYAPCVDDELEALRWLTVDELAARRRQLVRDYDRELRNAHPDHDRVVAIRAAIDAIAQVQRERRDL